MSSFDIDVAVVGTRAQRAFLQYIAAAQVLGVGRVSLYDDGAHLLATDRRPEFVVLTDPLNDPDALAVVDRVREREAGVLCDSPFTLDRDEAIRRYAAAAERGLLLQVAPVWQHALRTESAIWSATKATDAEIVRHVVRVAGDTRTADALLFDPTGVARLRAALAGFATVGAANVSASVRDEGAVLVVRFAGDRPAGRRSTGDGSAGDRPAGGGSAGGRSASVRFASGRKVTASVCWADVPKDEVVFVGPRFTTWARFGASAGPPADAEGPVITIATSAGPYAPWVRRDLTEHRVQVLADALDAREHPSQGIPPHDDLLLLIVAAQKEVLKRLIAGERNPIVRF